MPNGEESIDGIALDGFGAAVSVSELLGTRCRQVPTDAGIYLVTYEGEERPEFLEVGTGGRFRDLDPNHPIEVLDANWVDGGRVVYVGKAAGEEGLYQRIRQLVRFGNGKRAAHRGGRALWQIAGAHALEVRWRTCAAAVAADQESEAIAAFADGHDGRRPFANMRD